MCAKFELTFPEQLKKKKKYNTFLVFHSGNIIMSGMIEELMEPAFNIFQNIITDSKNLIEEKLDL